MKRHCESKGHVPVSLIDPAIKRRVAPILFNSEVTQTSESAQSASSGTDLSGERMPPQAGRTEISTSEPQVPVPTVDNLAEPDLPLVYAPHALHTLQGTFPPPALPLPESLQQQTQQPGTEELQQQIVSSQELQRLESQTIDSSALGIYHPTLLPSHSYITL